MGTAESLGMVIFDLEVEVGTIDGSQITRDILFMGQLYSRRKSILLHVRQRVSLADVWQGSHMLAVQHGTF